MRLLISGYFGFGNIGDEAILAATVEQLRIRRPGDELVVLSASPWRTEAQYGVTAASRSSPLAVWRELRAADLLICGGGGLIQDTTSLLSPLYYLGVLALARVAKTPYMIFAHGLGPLQRRLICRLAASVVTRAQAVTLRDEQSAQLLRYGLGVTEPQVHVTADLALLLSPCPAGRAAELLVNCGVSAEGPLVGISVRSWPQMGIEEAVAGLIHYLHDEIEAQVLLIPFQSVKDMSVAWRLASDAGGPVAILEGISDPRDFLGVISSLDLLVSMRLHGLIFAASTAVSALGICYDPKVDYFAQTAQQPAIKLDELSAQRLIQEVDELWATRQSGAGRRQQLTNRLRRRAERNFDILDEILEAL